MEILLFALHLFIVADVPVAVGIEVHHAAELYQVDRYDLAATLVSEHSGPAHRFSFGGSGWRGWAIPGQSNLGKEGRAPP
jgi:hypothetical protein